MTGSRHSAASSPSGIAIYRRLVARRTVSRRLQRPYRAGLGAGLAVILVGGASAAAVVDDADATAARSELTSLGLEVEEESGLTVEAPEVEDWGLEPIEVEIELDKSDVLHLREVQVAARNAEREELAELAEIEAAEEEAAQQQAAEEQAAEQQTDEQESAADDGGGEPSGDVVASAGDERGSLAAMVNDLRGQNGLAALSRDGTLDQVAQSWAEHMASTQVLQHNPNYDSQIGGGWSRSGENIVRNTGAASWSSGKITSWMFNWWQNSAPHRANMLNTAYTHVGVGYAMGSGGPYAVLVFGGR